MESYGLGVDDLFDDHKIESDLEESDDGFTRNRQEDEPSDINDVNDADDAADDAGNISRQVAEKLKNLNAGAAKKRVLRPQPKLDPDRLCGQRGIPVLPQLFKDLKFKGKGHEAADLSSMMLKLEHWAHRLFPKMPFDEVIERIERLGQKKSVQTVLNKIRLDMPILSQDFVTENADDDDDDGKDKSKDMTANGAIESDYEAIDDLIEGESINHTSGSQTVTSTPYCPEKNHREAGRVDGPSKTLTEEQMERMRLKHEAAKQLRIQRIAVETGNTST